jgi:outer membrane biosynthesis protein TonB
MNLFHRRSGKVIWRTTFFWLLACLLLLLPSQSVLAQTPTKTGRKVIVRVEPEYPAFFKYGRFQAHVIAQVTVLPNGNVSHVDIKSGNPMFAEYATKALMKWKYAPAPAQTVEEVAFNFN